MHKFCFKSQFYKTSDDIPKLAPISKIISLGLFLQTNRIP